MTTDDAFAAARRAHRPLAPLAAVGSLAVTFAAAAIGSLATMPAIDGWYASLEKPPFTPPNAVFGPVWTLLYLAMAVVLWQIWRVPRTSPPVAAARRAALVAYGVQIVLNALWSVVFFGLEMPTAALAVVLALWAAIVVLWRRARPLIGGWAHLLVPYLAWVAYAALLNGSIVYLALR